MDIKNAVSVVLNPSADSIAGMQPGSDAKDVTALKTQDDTGRQNTTDKKEERKVSEEEMNNVAAEMNKFMQSLNTDIQFTVHEKTQRMIVQVVDTKTSTVLREFPAHELLDTLAGIRDYVGILLDKKV